MHCSGDLIGQIEEAERRPHDDLEMRCAPALAGNGSQVALVPANGSPGSVDDDAVVSNIPAIRLARDTRDVPDDGPVQPLSFLRIEVDRLLYAPQAEPG